MKYLDLLLRMLRYRVAAMLLLFFFISAAAHGGLAIVSWKHLLAIIALLASYVAATTVNDIIDRDIDQINHPGNPSRPLVLGIANVNDLWRLHAGVAAVALIMGFSMSIAAGVAMIVSLTINYLYSAQPFRLSYRTLYAPLILGIGYVGVPYALGVALGGSRWNKTDVWLGSMLFILFLGRIILKDFRDRKGDAQFGKPTFLLMYGKRATCQFSGSAILIASCFLYVILPTVLALPLQLYVLTLLIPLWRLWSHSDHLQEQISIALGAKLGNGLLLALLGVLLLQKNAAPINVQLVFALVVCLLFLGNFFYLVQRPTDIVLAYKG